jgi:acyl-CoA hydrolase
MAGEQSCQRKYSISSTVLETVNHVLIRNANPLGNLHGGVMLSWMIDAATMTAMRVARRPTVLASMEDIFFLSPVHVGENVVITSWVNYIGRSSLDVSVYVEAENPIVSEERRLTTFSHMILVAVNKRLRPVRVDACIEPRGSLENDMYYDALQRREERMRRIASRRERVRDLEPPRPLDKRYYAVSLKFAYPEDAVFYNAVYAGKLAYYLDEMAGIIGMRYSRGAVVTASVDTTDFYAPILVGEAMEIHGALTYVGRSSMEVTIKVIARREDTGEAKHATTSYFTVVAVNESGRARPVPPFKPEENWQAELYKLAEARRQRRLRLLNRLKNLKVPKLSRAPG